jgi:hypothetical protein
MATVLHLQIMLACATGHGSFPSGKELIPFFEIFDLSMQS